MKIRKKEYGDCNMVGKNIERLRRERGIKQKDFISRMQTMGLDINPTSYSKLEGQVRLASDKELFIISKLLNVSIDYLLDDGEVIDEVVMREPYNLSDYGKDIKKKKKDRVIREKFPDAEIHTLLGKFKLTKSEKVIDNLLGFFTDAPFGTPELINSFKNMDKEFYLVKKDGKQFLVTVTDEFIETRQLAKRITANKFEIGNWKFTKCAYEVKDIKKEGNENEKGK